MATTDRQRVQVVSVVLTQAAEIRKVPSYAATYLLYVPSKCT